MATIFNFKDPNPGIWFKFDADDPESGEICIRATNQARRDEIRKKTMKKRDLFKHGQRFEIVETNDELFSEMLWDYSIVDWKGLVDEDEKPIPCTTETKVKLMTENVGFSVLVGEFINQINEEYEDRKAAAEKNSLSGSGASRKSRPAKSAAN